MSKKNKLWMLMLATGLAACKAEKETTVLDDIHRLATEIIAANEGLTLEIEELPAIPREEVTLFLDNLTPMEKAQVEMLWENAKSGPVYK